MHAGREAHKVDGRAEEEGICFFSLREERRQVVFYDARAVVLVFSLTVKTTDTAFVIQGIEVDVFWSAPEAAAPRRASFNSFAVLPLRRGLPLKAIIFIIHHPFF